MLCERGMGLSMPLDDGRGRQEAMVHKRDMPVKAGLQASMLNDEILRGRKVLPKPDNGAASNKISNVITLLCH